MKILKEHRGDFMSNEARGMIKGTVIISAVGLAAGILAILFVPDIFETQGIIFYAVGVILGGTASMLRIVLLERSVTKALDTEDKARANNTMRIGYAYRYLLTGLALLGGWLSGYFFEMGAYGFIGAFVGTLAMAISAYTAKLFIKAEKR